jgi:hypothetical protein
LFLTEFFASHLPFLVSNKEIPGGAIRWLQVTQLDIGLPFDHDF